MLESQSPGPAYKLRHAAWAVAMAKKRIGSAEQLERLNREHLGKDNWKLDAVSKKVISKYGARGRGRGRCSQRCCPPSYRASLRHGSRRGGARPPPHTHLEPHTPRLVS